MIRSFKDKMKVKQEAYQAEQERLAIIEEQKRKEREWELFDLEQKAIAEKNQQILAEEEARQHAEYVQWKQEQRILQEQQEQMPAKPINTGIGMGHDATWKLTWMSFSTHPKIIDLPMSEKIRLFKIAQSRENDRMNQPAVLGGSSTEALVNYALSFSGDRSGATDSYATTTFNPDNYSLWNGFTLSFWIRPDELMNQTSTILGCKATGDVARFHVGFDSAGNDIRLGIGTGDMDNISNTLEVGKWSHILVTYAGTQQDSGERSVRMWVDLDPKLTGTNNISWNNQDEATETYTHGIYFGGRNTEGTGYSQGFACALDEVAIYNRSIDLDGTFATEVYNGGTSYNHLTNGQSGLVGYWKFNEGSGTTITDHSGNGNHGTFGAISGDTTAHPIWINR